MSIAPATSIAGLVVGIDNNLYFGDPAGNKIAQLKIGSAIAEFPIPTANAQPDFLELGFDGKVYFSEMVGNKIGQFTYF
jgi:virginiamycin B lyase